MCAALSSQRIPFKFYQCCQGLCIKYLLNHRIVIKLIPGAVNKALGSCNYAHAHTQPADKLLGREEFMSSKSAKTTPVGAAPPACSR